MLLLAETGVLLASDTPDGFRPDNYEELVLFYYITAPELEK